MEKFAFEVEELKDNVKLHSDLKLHAVMKRICVVWKSRQAEVNLDGAAG